MFLSLDRSAKRKAKPACRAVILWGALASCALPSDFERKAIPGPPVGELTGAALDGSVLYTWGDKLAQWRLPAGPVNVLRSGPFGEGGCLVDVNGDGRPDTVVEEGRGLGRLVWFAAPDHRRHEIDSGIETHDVVPAQLFGRRGILVVQRYAQIRFYEIPQRPVERWPYREIYSFYTPSRQGGLALGDVDEDGRTDIFCGNYWIRSPEAFELPWRLFAINLWSETPDSATLRLVVSGLTGDGARELAAAQAEMSPARLAWFEQPPDPKGLWFEHRIDVVAELGRPHGLAAADFDGDGRTDLTVGENRGARSRLVLLLNEGQGMWQPRVLSAGDPVRTLIAADLDHDGAPDLLVLRANGVEWHRNRTYRRR
jgi:hypothetical protein